MVTDAALNADGAAALAEGGRLPLPWLAEPLHQALTQGRSHALLLQGPAGVGQFDLALLLAQAWLCEARSSTDQPGCGRCASCHLLRSRSHPDFQVLLPEALREALGFGAMEAEGRARPRPRPARPSPAARSRSRRSARCCRSRRSARRAARPRWSWCTRRRR
ncbi:hypothetical protein ACQ859_21525 [Roseateles chitinivorans]|uniref:hypothetical protein n=1 Tax=Roseateles chitinivorans TaxID=2917965 RepID=UPI003D6727E2